jgi:hypothetical protein
MNDSIRTVVFVAVAAVVALGAYITKPRLESGPSVTDGIPVGEPLFKDFKDPLLAKKLEIKQFDETLAKAATFEVTQQSGGRWTLPSHGNYPADAESQLKAVAETFADLKVIGHAGKENTEHELYGVNDPDKADVGTKGVGTLITMQNNKGDDLLRMIVGKEVDGAQNQRFVRKPGEDIVYVTSIDMAKLPTEFEKWIEKDLLKISTFDVTRVVLKDYLVLPTQSGRMQLVQRFDATLDYVQDKGEWKPVEMNAVKGRERAPAPLSELEEINKQKLDDLRNALGDLKIVDVRKKPEGLGNSLRVSADKLPVDQQRDLQDLGFYPYSAAEGKQLDIFGANGEVIVDTKDGIEYVLRFGEIKPQTAVANTSKKATQPNSDKSKSAADDEVKVQRYLFVTTQLAPSVLTPPELEPEPAGPAPATDPAAADASKKNDAAKAADSKAGEQKADEVKSNEEKAAVVDPQQAERERIKKDNERKLNAYRDQKKKAELRVGELNARFADWYYVVAEDVYKKIRLTRSDIVKEKAAAKDEGFGIDAFRKLETDGVKGESKASPVPGLQGGPPGAIHGGFPGGIPNMP